MVPSESRTPYGAIRCKATAKSTGERCRRWSIAGADVCTVHGVNQALRTKAKANVARQQAEQELARIGGRRDISGADAISEMVEEWAFNVGYYREMAQGLDELTQVDGGGEKSDGRVVPHVYVQMYEAACDRLVHFSQIEVNLGIAERRLELQEMAGQRIAALLRAFLDDPEMELSDGQRGVAPTVLRRHLKALNAVATTGIKVV